MKDFLTDQEMMSLETQGLSAGPGLISDERLAMRENIAAEQESFNKEASKSVGRRFLSALPGEAANTLIRNPIRFAASAAMAPVDIARQGYGLATGKNIKPISTKLPFIGESFQSELGRKGEEVVEGDRSLWSVAGGLAEVPLAGIEAGTIPGASRAARRFLTGAAEKTSAYLTSRAERKALEFATDLTARNPLKNPSIDAIKKGTPGYEAPKLFKKGRIKPTPKDIKVAEAVAPYVNPRKSVQENIDNINQGISQTNLGVREMVANYKVPFNTAQLRANLSVAKTDNELVFAGDAPAEKAYGAVIDEFVRFTKDKDTVGLFDARQSFDSYMKAKFPNLFKMDKTGQFLDPRDNARVNAILDVRKAANDYVADLLPANNPYKSTLRRESYMLEALGRIAEKNWRTLGKNKIQILSDQYPILKWLTGLAVGSGIGAGGALILSSD